METAIEQTKLLISKYYKRDYIKAENYGKFYMFTNENVNAYLKAASVTHDQKALSVLASGDQAFNLISKGIKDVDTFDKNKLTEYYVFGIKMAMILNYNYAGFLKTSEKLLDANTSPTEIVAIISDLLPHMDEKYRKYWREIVEHYLTEEKNSMFKNHCNLFYILKIETARLERACNYNAYMLDEEHYNEFKSKLLQSNIRFRHSNITDLPQNFQSKYDYLLFSNILDYIYLNWGEFWSIKKLDNYIDSLKPILNHDVLIFLHYCFSLDYEPIDCTDIKITDFSKDELLRFKGVFNDTEYMILRRIK